MIGRRESSKAAEDIRISRDFAIKKEPETLQKMDLHQSSSPRLSRFKEGPAHKKDVPETNQS